ncbi:hypothetical protein RIF29_32469 [Crotalaria pallida]|uniref:Uncharacterized protein n=1 Tax=Crotalaria pallida TaxID=3830 RepID=A0AAN9EKQ3_CROPI
MGIRAIRDGGGPHRHRQICKHDGEFGVTTTHVFLHRHPSYHAMVVWVWAVEVQVRMEGIEEKESVLKMTMDGGGDIALTRIPYLNSGRGKKKKEEKDTDLGLALINYPRIPECEAINLPSNSHNHNFATHCYSLHSSFFLSLSLVFFLQFNNHLMTP